MENVIGVGVGEGYAGEVGLCKVFGSKGGVVNVGVYDRRGRKEVLKGYLLIKLNNIHVQP